jgi:OmcA/MtrC family decaheme c-type cytochrome
VIDASNTPFSLLAQLDVVSEITDVTIASPPVVTFTMKTASDQPIIGLVPFWQANNRFVRFTITKLVPGENGDPDSWVAYVLDNGEPDYDSGASLVDNEDGSYAFTFNTDVTAVTGVTYEPTLTHRVAGQIGQLSTVPLEEQNLWLDFVPDGSAVTNTRNIAVMESCNECHTDLVFHGRRFLVEYCVQCHNPDLADGEGDMAFMIHRIHNAGDFDVLDGGISYAEVTYPQDVANCRKCHNADDAETPEADNWRNLPNIQACDGCHDVFATNTHTGGPQADNQRCVNCHGPADVARYHTTPNATPNNPDLLAGQRNIAYELVDAEVDGNNVVTIRFKILSDGTALDVTNLPTDLATPNRFPGLLLAWAQPQDGFAEPADYNNLGRNAAQPLSLGLNTFGPINTTNPIGTLTYNAADGVTTATVTAAASQFPVGAMLRAVGLQGYFQQDISGTVVALHTPSAVVAVTGDDERRAIVDSEKCASCHEWFEGHGGNRVYEMAICTLCHVPNLSSSGRTLDLNHPEDTQNLKEMIHGIHASDVRDRDYEHVRNFNGNANVYNWSEVTFPANTADCTICHIEGTYGLPLPGDLLSTVVRTTGVADGQDLTTADVTTARSGANLPNATDWVNTPTASSCFYCHTSEQSWAHMVQNGAQLSLPAGGVVTNRSSLSGIVESCSICHGEGRSSDVRVVHSR